MPTGGDAPFFMHSCHCYFLLAGSSDVPILFHVERVRDGRSFATRTVQARQRGRCIFTVTVSFVREGAGGDKALRHAAPLPDGVRPPAADDTAFEEPWMGMGPFQARPAEIVDADGKKLADAVEEGVHADGREHEMKCRMWTRARGTISPEGGHAAHLIALAYVSDSYFIGTVSRVHRLWKFPFAPGDVAGMDPERKDLIRRLHHFDGIGGDVEDAEHWDTRPKLGMVVSLDHSIYFHEPRRIKADDWMFCEMETPWSGDGRGVVSQRIFAADGTLLATCVQEVSIGRGCHALPLATSLTVADHSFRASYDSSGMRTNRKRASSRPGTGHKPSWQCTIKNARLTSLHSTPSRLDAAVNRQSRYPPKVVSRTRETLAGGMVLFE